MSLNIILFICFVPVWIILYLTLMNNLKPKKNIILGVTLPHYAHDDPATKLICQSFKKWLNIVMLSLLLLMIPPFFMQLMGQIMTWLMTWLLLTLIGSMAVFAKHRGKLMELKRANNWYSEATDTGSLYLDEDEYWLFGLIYHNPNDNHLLVNNRVGMNMSINLAKPFGKIIMGLTVLIIAALPFTGILMWNAETTPTRLILSETTLTTRHTRDKYVIRLDSIESAELLETLPSMLRVAGTGFENLNKGNFRAGSYGISRVCLQPKDPPFLVIRSGGHTYIINDADNKVTREVYNLIRIY
jgi:hypothetical protein